MKKVDPFILYTFCADYHSGQWSRGYRILCRIYTWSKGHININSACMAECRETEEYQVLVGKYADKV